MKLRVFALYEYLWSNPLWRWWGRKVCMLAARHYAGIDSIDDFKRPIHFGGRRYDSEARFPILNVQERRWIEKNREKVLGEIAMKHE